jgi:hypothetical protein
MMRIGVMVSSWEQACCGAPFRVGDDVRWDLTWGQDWISRSFGTETAMGFDYAETHHGGDDAARTSVRGNIASIRAVSQRLHRPDPAGPWTTLEGESTSAPIDEVPGREQITGAEPETPKAAASDQLSAPERAFDDAKLGTTVRGWYALNSLRRHEKDDLIDQISVAGWIVQLDVDDDTDLPAAPKR